MRRAWVRVLAPVVGGHHAVVLLDVVDQVAPLHRRLLHSEHVAFVTSLGRADVARSLILTKALKTCVALLAWPDADLELHVTAVVPAATWELLARIASRLRDHLAAAPEHHEELIR